VCWKDTNLQTPLASCYLGHAIDPARPAGDHPRACRQGPNDGANQPQVREVPAPDDGHAHFWDYRDGRRRTSEYACSRVYWVVSVLTKWYRVSRCHSPPPSGGKSLFSSRKRGFPPAGLRHGLLPAWREPVQ